MIDRASKIRNLLAARDELQAQLVIADRELIAEGRLFWEAQGCKAFPRVDALRRAVNS